ANTPEHKRLLSDLLLSEPLPWVWFSDSSPTGSQERLLPQDSLVGSLFPPTPSPALPFTISSSSTAETHTVLLTRDQYVDMHKLSAYSVFYVEPVLILNNFSACIAGKLLSAPLAPWEGETYTDADGYDHPAF